MISLIISVVVLGLIYWLITLLPLPDFAQSIVKVVFIIIAILWVLRAFSGYF